MKTIHGFILDRVTTFAHRTLGKLQKYSKQPFANLRFWIQSSSIVCSAAVCCQTEDIALKLNKIVVRTAQ